MIDLLDDYSIVGFETLAVEVSTPFELSYPV